MHIGTAGWSIPRAAAEAFPKEGSALERYAGRFRAAEINSSFHRPHRVSTWQNWRDSTPPTFRFSVKVPKTITHQLKLVSCEAELDAFVEQASALRQKLAVLLVQLPPKLEFDATVADAFFAQLVGRSTASVACEPRHPSWFEPEADRLLAARKVARVAADPPKDRAGSAPGGWRGLSYWRLHGSPVIYRSSYADRLSGYAAQLRAESEERETWCIFDNTASSAAGADALALQQMLG